MARLTANRAQIKVREFDRKKDELSKLITALRLESRKERNG